MTTTTKPSLVANDEATGLPVSQRTIHQARQYGPVAYKENGRRYRITATARYDDCCNNGHNSFAITAKICGPDGFESGGCCHDEVAKHFPELAPFIKWHLCSSDGPMHYIANTVYLAGDRDCNGLLKGKARELDAARRAAIWLDATDEELTAPGLKERLAARLPALMAEFKTAMASLGFTY